MDIEKAVISEDEEKKMIKEEIEELKKDNYEIKHRMNTIINELNERMGTMEKELEEAKVEITRLQQQNKKLVENNIRNLEEKDKVI